VNHGKGGLAAVCFKEDKPGSPPAWLGDSDLTGERERDRGRNFWSVSIIASNKVPQSVLGRSPLTDTLTLGRPDRERGREDK
jgi:hypothetical protein